MFSDKDEFDNENNAEIERQLDQLVIGDDLEDVFFDEEDNNGNVFFDDNKELPRQSDAEHGNGGLEADEAMVEPEPVTRFEAEATAEPKPVRVIELEATVEPEPVTIFEAEATAEPEPATIFEAEATAEPELVTRFEAEATAEPEPVRVIELEATVEPESVTIFEVEATAEPEVQREINSYTVSEAESETDYKTLKNELNKKYRDNTLGCGDIEKYINAIRSRAEEAGLESTLNKISSKLLEADHSKEFAKCFIELKRLYRDAGIK